MRCRLAVTEISSQAEYLDKEDVLILKPKNEHLSVLFHSENYWKENYLLENQCMISSIRFNKYIYSYKIISLPVIRVLRLEIFQGKLSATCHKTNRGKDVEEWTRRSVLVAVE